MQSHANLSFCLNVWLSNRMADLYGEITTFVKEKPHSGDFTNVVLNSYVIK